MNMTWHQDRKSEIQNVTYSVTVVQCLERHAVNLLYGILLAMFLLVNLGTRMNYCEKYCIVLLQLR